MFGRIVLTFEMVSIICHVLAEYNRDVKTKEVLKWRNVRYVVSWDNMLIGISFAFKFPFKYRWGQPSISSFCLDEFKYQLRISANLN